MASVATSATDDRVRRRRVNPRAGGCGGTGRRAGSRRGSRRRGCRCRSRCGRGSSSTNGSTSAIAGEHDQLATQDPARAVRELERDRHDHREHQVELLLDRDRPAVLQRRRRAEQVGVRVPREQEPPVGDVGERALDVAGERGPLAGIPHEQSEDDHQTEHHEQRGREAAEPPTPELHEVDPSGVGVAVEQEPGDEEARQREEQRDAEVSAAGPLEPTVEEQDPERREAANPVEAGIVRQLPTCGACDTSPPVASGASTIRRGSVTRPMGADRRRHTRRRLVRARGLCDVDRHRGARRSDRALARRGRRPDPGRRRGARRGATRPRRRNVSWLDRRGHLHLTVPGLFVDAAFTPPGRTA